MRTTLKGVLATVRRSVGEALPAPVASWLRIGRRRWAEVTFRRRIVERSFGGLPLRLELTDPLAESWYDRDWDPLGEIELLRSRGRLGAESTVFDLGGHQGVVAMMLAAVAEDGTVVAVEADSHNHVVARHNAELNGCENVVNVHAVAAAAPGRLGFTAQWNGNVDLDGRFGTERVQAVSVDSLAEQYGFPSVVFVDVEGYELEVLKGAEKTFATRPDWFIEVHAGCGLERFGGSSEAVGELLVDRDYEIHIAPGEGLPFEPWDGTWPSSRFFLVALAG
ncbi:MAG: hypothetical protein AVDCRST_MAG50-3244 [uncultured Acidimicrobiales bacterium]|uniref:Methyltransferase FkbM domain-containing protein n=1 Tax=uncultured Acidimicrobiales bacterium TaxID=310071 RepID=A0A6J4J364_9ACTN|nr:MAG: hypothetical protein AVDCRST_MAG50-3244 [uncultured Acidimicrobiales bacterium]